MVSANWDCHPVQDLTSSYWLMQVNRVATANVWLKRCVAWAERPRFVSSHSVTPSVWGKHTLNSRRVDHLSEFAACGDGSYPQLLSRLSRILLPVLDDWGTAPLGPSESRDILKIVDGRGQLSSTIIAVKASLKSPTVTAAKEPRHKQCR